MAILPLSTCSVALLGFMAMALSTVARALSALPVEYCSAASVASTSARATFHFSVSCCLAVGWGLEDGELHPTAAARTRMGRIFLMRMNYSIRRVGTAHQ